MNVRFITAIHFVIEAKEIGIINKEIALEKMKRLARFGRYRAEIVENAIKRIRGDE